MNHIGLQGHWLPPQPSLNPPSSHRLSSPPVSIQHKRGHHMHALPQNHLSSSTPGSFPPLPSTCSGQQMLVTSRPELTSCVTYAAPEPLDPSLQCKEQPRYRVTPRPYRLSGKWTDQNGQDRCSSGASLGSYYIPAKNFQTGFCQCPGS